MEKELTEQTIREAAKAAMAKANELGNTIIQMRQLGLVKDGENVTEYPSVSVQLYEAMRRLEDVVARINMIAAELYKYSVEAGENILKGKFDAPPQEN